MVWEERWHPLRREWVIVSSHRNDRPWLGETVGEGGRVDAGVRPGLLSLSAERADLGRAESRLPSRCSCSTTTIRASGRTSPELPAPRPASTRTGAPTGWRASSATRRGTTSPSPSCRRARSCDCSRPSASSTCELGARPEVRHVLVVREQGRSGRREQPAPARADLRDELRLPHDRGGGAGGGGPLAEHGRVLFRDIIDAEEEDGRRILVQQAKRAVVRPVLRALSVRDVRRAARDARESRRSVRRRAGRFRASAAAHARADGQPVADVVPVRDGAASGADGRRGVSRDSTSTSRSIRRCGSPGCSSISAGRRSAAGNFLNDTAPEEKAAELARPPRRSTTARRSLDA